MPIAAPRQPIIAANWKMHMTPQDSDDFLRAFARLVPDKVPVQIVIAPPAVSLERAHNVLTAAREPSVALAAQNMSQHTAGAFTGEISARMVKECGCKYVILGHSERRQYQRESDELVAAKAKAAHEAGLKPIVCVGEQLEDREGGRTEEVVGTQIRGSLAGLTTAQMEGTVVAYEPVWAIGTGKTATSAQAQEVHSFIRNLLGDIFDEDTARRLRIQYGGSVKPDNARELMSQTDVDGALVGGASLDVRNFSEIILNSI